MCLPLLQGIYVIGRLTLNSSLYHIARYPSTPQQVSLSVRPSVIKNDVQAYLCLRHVKQDDQTNAA